MSPRTFNSYFSSKEEAIVGSGADRVAAVRAALRSRPPGESLWQAVSQTVIEMFPGNEPDRSWLARVQLVKATPALAAQRLKSDAMVERVLAEEIAARTATDIERDLHLRLAAAAFVAAVHAALDYWLDAPATTRLRSTVTRALRQVATCPLHRRLRVDIVNIAARARERFRLSASTPESEAPAGVGYHRNRAGSAEASTRTPYPRHSSSKAVSTWSPAAPVATLGRPRRCVDSW